MQPDDFQRKPILKKDIGKINSLLGLKHGKLNENLTAATDSLGSEGNPLQSNDKIAAPSVPLSPKNQTFNSSEKQNASHARPGKQPMFSLGGASFVEDGLKNEGAADLESSSSLLENEKVHGIHASELVDSFTSKSLASTHPFHQVKSQPIISHHGNHQYNIRQGIPISTGYHSFSRPGVGIPTHHHSTFNSSTLSHDPSSMSFDPKTYSSGYQRDPSNIKTGIRLRRQSSYTNTSTADSTPSSSFLPNSFNSASVPQDIPIHALSLNSKLSDEGPVSPTALSTWSSSKIGIKKKKSIHSGSAKAPFFIPKLSQSPSKRSNTFDVNSVSPPRTTLSPAASFMNTLNMTTANSAGSLESVDEYGVGDEIGDYTLIKEIGTGAFSKVFEAVTPVAPFFLQHQQESSPVASCPLSFMSPSNQEKSGVLYNVAVKVVLKSSSTDEDGESQYEPQIRNRAFIRGDGATRESELDYLRQIDRETAIWSRLHHPYLLEMNEVIRLQDATIIISELASGGTLLSYIQTHGSPGLPESISKRFFKQIAEALFYLHLTVGIIHHDIKLENVLLTSDLQVKVCDFGFSVEINGGGDRGHGPYCPGLCCAVRNGLLTGAELGETIHLSLQRTNSSSEEKGVNAVTGSLHYLAPEHLMPQSISKESDEEIPMGDKSDIWAFGCILYAMLTGTLPFFESFLPRLQMSIINGAYDHTRLDNSKATSDAKVLIEHMLQKDWKTRYSIKECIQSNWLRRSD